MKKIRVALAAAIAFCIVTASATIHAQGIHRDAGVEAEQEAISCADDRVDNATDRVTCAAAGCNGAHCNHVQCNRFGCKHAVCRVDRPNRTVAAVRCPAKKCKDGSCEVCCRERQRFASEFRCPVGRCRDGSCVECQRRLQALRQGFRERTFQQRGNFSPDGYTEEVFEQDGFTQHGFRQGGFRGFGYQGDFSQEEFSQEGLPQGNQGRYRQGNFQPGESGQQGRFLQGGFRQWWGQPGEFQQEDGSQGIDQQGYVMQDGVRQGGFWQGGFWQGAGPRGAYPGYPPQAYWQGAGQPEPGMIYPPGAYPQGYPPFAPYSPEHGYGFPPDGLTNQYGYGQMEMCPGKVNGVCPVHGYGACPHERQPLGQTLKQALAAVDCSHSPDRPLFVPREQYDPNYQPCFPGLRAKLFSKPEPKYMTTAPVDPMPTYTTRGPRDFLNPNPPSIGY